MLLKKGADINTQSDAFNDALQHASLHGYQEVVRILLENGVDVNT